MSNCHCSKKGRPYHPDLPYTIAEGALSQRLPTTRPNVRDYSRSKPTPTRPVPITPPITAITAGFERRLIHGNWGEHPPLNRF